ncbi:DUF4091 domain-containing protein [Paenibacillus sp. P25]|nr:DUF4091 domain-containing protein [Paenibacillus sp. P25]
MKRHDPKVVEANSPRYSVVQFGAPVAQAKTESEFTVWVPTNTQKVMRDEPFPAESAGKPQTLLMGAARNEYESGQVIVKAGDTPLRKLQVSVSELKQTDGNEKISNENIELFREHYIQVTKPTTSYFPAGWYPDALIPLSGLLEVPARQNQGIWIKVKVPKGQAAGVYTGEMTLHETGNPVRIPITLTVWDFEMTDESHSETAFTLWGDQISFAHNNVHGDEFWKLMDKYYWASVDSRIVPSYLPIPADDVSRFAELAVPYITNPKVSAYRLPLYLDAQKQPDWSKTKQLVDLMREKGLLAKAFFYLGSQIDEPAPSVYPKVREYAAKMKEIAPDVRHFVTTQPVDELVPDVSNWVALINKYDKSFAQERQAAGDHVWWYTSVNPKHPYPSYHIDDNLIGARLLSWMQKDYGVEGNLFWSTTIFKKYDGKQYVPRDVWTDPMAFPGANGDGFLFYPGTGLGIDGPVGTIRLEAIREGMEDYEYLWRLEQRLKQTASKLGVANQFPYHDALQIYYDRLYRDIRSYADDPANLLSVRQDVAEDIVGMKSGPAYPGIGNFRCIWSWSHCDRVYGAGSPGTNRRSDRSARRARYGLCEIYGRRAGTRRAQ